MSVRKGDYRGRNRDENADVLGGRAPLPAERDMNIDGPSTSNGKGNYRGRERGGPVGGGGAGAGGGRRSPSPGSYRGRSSFSERDRDRDRSNGRERDVDRAYSVVDNRGQRRGYDGPPGEAAGKGNRARYADDLSNPRRANSNTVNTNKRKGNDGRRERDSYMGTAGQQAGAREDRFAKQREPPAASTSYNTHTSRDNLDQQYRPDDDDGDGDRNDNSYEHEEGEEGEHPARTVQSSLDAQQQQHYKRPRLDMDDPPPSATSSAPSGNADRASSQAASTSATTKAKGVYERPADRQRERERPRSRDRERPIDRDRDRERDRDRGRDRLPERDDRDRDREYRGSRRDPPRPRTQKQIYDRLQLRRSLSPTAPPATFRTTVRRQQPAPSQSNRSRSGSPPSRRSLSPASSTFSGFIGRSTTNRRRSPSPGGGVGGSGVVRKKWVPGPGGGRIEQASDSPGPDRRRDRSISPTYSDRDDRNRRDRRDEAYQRHNPDVNAQAPEHDRPMRSWQPLTQPHEERMDAIPFRAGPPLPSELDHVFRPPLPTPDDLMRSQLGYAGQALGHADWSAQHQHDQGSYRQSSHEQSSYPANPQQQQQQQQYPTPEQLAQGLQTQQPSYSYGETSQQPGYTPQNYQQQQYQHPQQQEQPHLSSYSSYSHPQQHQQTSSTPLPPHLPHPSQLGIFPLPPSMSQSSPTVAQYSPEPNSAASQRAPPPFPGLPPHGFPLPPGIPLPPPSASSASGSSAQSPLTAFEPRQLSIGIRAPPPGPKSAAVKGFRPIAGFVPIGQQTDATQQVSQEPGYNPNNIPPAEFAIPAHRNGSAPFPLPSTLQAAGLPVPPHITWQLPSSANGQNQQQRQQQQQQLQNRHSPEQSMPPALPSSHAPLFPSLASLASSSSSTSLSSQQVQQPAPLPSPSHLPRPPNSLPPPPSPAGSATPALHGIAGLPAKPSFKALSPQTAPTADSNVNASTGTASSGAAPALSGPTPTSSSLLPSFLPQKPNFTGVSPGKSAAASVPAPTASTGIETPSTSGKRRSTWQLPQMPEHLRGPGGESEQPSPSSTSSQHPTIQGLPLPPNLYQQRQLQQAAEQEGSTTPSTPIHLTQPSTQATTAGDAPYPSPAPISLLSGIKSLPPKPVTAFSMAAAAATGSPSPITTPSAAAQNASGNTDASQSAPDAISSLLAQAKESSAPASGSREPAAPADFAASDSRSKPQAGARGNLDLYERLVQVGEGTYGKVYKARNTEAGTLVAMKRIRMEAEKDGFPVTSVREIKLLQSLNHENVVCLQEMMVSKGHVYMVFEYLDHDLTGILHHPGVHFSPANLKSLMQQLLRGLDYIHWRGVLHRDLKGSNILLSKAGELKIADFGLAKFYAKGRKNDYTNRVITQWYKPPELLFGETVYGPEVDIWSAGCIFLELFTKRPVFQGQDEIHQLDVIYKLMGTPDETSWPGLSQLPWYELVKPKNVIPSSFRDVYATEHFRACPAALDVGEGLLAFDPSSRPSAQQALELPYFTTEEPAPEQPTWLAEIKGDWHEMESKEASRKKRGEMKRQQQQHHAQEQSMKHKQMA